MGFDSNAWFMETAWFRETVARAVEAGRVWGNSFINDPKWQGDRNRMANHAIYESTMWSLGAGVATGAVGWFGVPVDLVNALYSQVKLSSALFTIHGISISDESTNESTNEAILVIIVAAALGVSVKEFATQFGTRFLVQAANRVIENAAINAAKRQAPKAVGEILKRMPRPLVLKIISRVSGKSVAMIPKAIPVIGGIIGGGVNATMMNVCGHSVLKFIKAMGSDPGYAT